MKAYSSDEFEFYGTHSPDWGEVTPPGDGWVLISHSCCAVGDYVQHALLWMRVRDDEDEE